MSFNVQFPGSVAIYRDQMVEIPSTGTVHQRSCYSYLEKLTGVTNPLNFQSDVIYPNALAETLQSEDGTGGGHPTAVGCTGHMIDNEFPLELKTPFALPLVMYPTVAGGNKHHDADLCAMPVLNWETYIHEVRNCKITTTKVEMSKLEGTEKERDPLGEGEPLSVPTDVPEELNDEDSNVPDIEKTPEPVATCTSTFKAKASRKITLTSMLIHSQKPHDVEETGQERNKRILAEIKARKSKAGKEDDVLLTMESKPRVSLKKLPMPCLRKIKRVPQFRVQGSWNYLFGGYNGACCFLRTGFSTKSSNKHTLNLYVGKGSLLRAVELEQSVLPYVNPYKVVSVWDEDEGSLPFNANSNADDPFSDLIFQIIQNEKNDMVAVRRGKSVQIYSTEKLTGPYLLKSVPNTRYGTSDYYPCKRRSYVEDPLMTGVDFNPILCSEVVTIDENCVVRFCDIGDGTTGDVFLLPKLPTITQSVRRKGYPSLKLNKASGIAFANSNNCFYAWYDSTIYRGDRRDPQISGSNLFPLFDVRNDIQMQAMSDQNFFQNDDVAINEYISCVRRSRKDPYYYVGTTRKVFLMDQRVPSHPVLKVNHGLQSPLAYMDTYADESENFETLVASSQRLPETMCVITNTGHTLCANRPGCKGKNPILHCYPTHLSNSRACFDFAVRQGHGFSFPGDYDEIKNHHYAWTTGLAVYPVVGPSDPKLPKGIIIATSNNFGDIFCQEWNQKPMPRHKKVGVGDGHLQTFMKEWSAAVTPKVTGKDVTLPSRNPNNPVDCSILLEPAAHQIKKLPRIRDYAFNCFKPHEMQYRSNLKSLVPLPDLISKLRSYKNEKVKPMLEVWSIEDIRQARRSTPDPNPSEVIHEVVIKEELPENEGSISHSSLHTIDIDASEHEAYSQQEHLQELSMIERDIRRAVNPEEEDYFAQVDPLQPDDEMDETKFEVSQQPGREAEEDLPDLPEDEQVGARAEWFSMQRLHSRMRDDEEINFNMDREANMFYSQPGSAAVDESMSQSLFAGDSQDFTGIQYASSSQPLPSTSFSQRPTKARLPTKKKKSGFL